MKTPKWYISSTLLWGLAPEKWFELASTYGLEGLEIWTQQLISENISPERIRQLKEETGLSLTVHDYSWDLNLISLSKPMRHGAMKMIRHGIDMAARMEADQITIHPGREGLLKCRRRCVYLLAYMDRKWAFRFLLKLWKRFPKNGLLLQRP